MVPEPAPICDVRGALVRRVIVCRAASTRRVDPRGIGAPWMTDWQQIVDDYGPQVWGTAYRLLGQEVDAADCFQQTFLAAFKAVDGKPVRYWSALLKRIATAALTVRRGSTGYPIRRSLYDPPGFGRRPCKTSQLSPLRAAVSPRCSPPVGLSVPRAHARTCQRTQRRNQDRDRDDFPCWQRLSQSWTSTVPAASLPNTSTTRTAMV